MISFMTFFEDRCPFFFNFFSFSRQIFVRSQSFCVYYVVLSNVMLSSSLYIFYSITNRFERRLLHINFVSYKILEKHKPTVPDDLIVGTSEVTKSITAERSKEASDDVMIQARTVRKNTPIVYDMIDETLVLSIAIDTKVGSGPSDMDADGWRRIVASSQYVSPKS